MPSVIASGSIIAAMPVALLAGLVSFLSPCVLPLLPAYLGLVSGSSSTHKRSRTILGAVLFVLGFSVVFVALGAGFGSLGTLVHGATKDALIRGLGVLVILFGVVMLGGFDFAQRTAKLNLRPRAGLIGAVLLGVVFGLGWTPCIGPTLGAVLNLAFTTGTVWRGVLLATVYSIGLGLPFILLAAGFSWASKSVGFVKRHIREFNIGGSILLIVLGVLLVTGLWNSFIDYLQGVLGGFAPAI